MSEAPPFTAIDHVQLAMPAGEEGRARRFFVEILGMRELEKPAELRARGGAWFASGDVQLHLGVDPDFRPAMKAHVALRCAHLVDLRHRLEDAGHAVSDVTAFGGGLHAYVDDPFGNRIELIGAAGGETH